MEVTLANVILNLLGLGFKSFTRDTDEDFFASVHFLLQFFPKFFSTKWDSLWMKMQIPKTSGAKVSCNKIIYGDEKRMQIEEVMNRLGMVGWLDESGVVSEDLVGLFDEEEPSLEEIKETFGVFDANKDGFIDAIELQIVLCNLGFKEGCNLVECKRMIGSCDSDGDGLIDIHDFVKFMEKCLC